MAYSSTITDIINNTAGWETTLASEYATYTEEQRRFTDLMVLRRSAPLNLSTETLTGADTLTASENGKTFFLNAAGGFNVTLPAAAAGLRFEFIVKTAPTTAYTITSATADTIYGKVFASSGGDENSNVAGDVLNFVANTSLAGDRAVFISDGTSWFADGFCDVTGSITITG